MIEWRGSRDDVRIAVERLCTQRSERLEREQQRVVRRYPFVEDHDVLECRQPVALFEDSTQLLGVLDEANPAGRMLEDVSDLWRGARRVHGHADRAERERPEVGFLPLRPVPRQDGDPIPVLDPERVEPSRGFLDRASVARPGC